MKVIRNAINKQESQSWIKLDSVNLIRQLIEGFKRSIYWNNYQTKPAELTEKGKRIYELFNASFQGVRTSFVLTYVVAAGVANDESRHRR